MSNNSQWTERPKFSHQSPLLPILNSLILNSNSLKKLLWKSRQSTLIQWVFRGSKSRQFHLYHQIINNSREDSNRSQNGIHLQRDELLRWKDQAPISTTILSKSRVLLVHQILKAYLLGELSFQLEEQITLEANRANWAHKMRLKMLKTKSIWKSFRR